MNSRLVGASSYQTSPHPVRHSDILPDRRTLKLLSTVRTLLYVQDTDYRIIAGRSFFFGQRFAGTAGDGAWHFCGADAYFPSANPQPGKRASRDPS